MIVVCEPQCKDISHEKINSGFLYGLRLAYPDETIRLYADSSHIRALKDILRHDNTSINNIEYVPIKFRGSLSIIEMLSFYFLFDNIFTTTLAAGTNKIFFLSFSPTILFIIKLLKHRQIFSNMKFTSVLHADFENIADINDRTIRPSLPGSPLAKIIRQTKLSEFPRKIVKFLRSRMSRMTTPWQPLLNKLFATKKMLLWEHSDDFKYIALSPHIVTNAKKYIDVENLNIHTVVMPTVFAPPIGSPNNRFPKFAIFGYGNPAMLHEVNSRLAQMNINKPFEIRIIGMDNSGTEDFPNTTCPSPGKRLPRNEMEKYAQDIDIFLILYGPESYLLSCSASIFESLSYMKPVLHFENDCLNTFNTQKSQIGICCRNEDDFANTMKDIIENYPAITSKLQIFRENILRMRETYSIENSVPQLQDSFTWGES